MTPHTIIWDFDGTLYPLRPLDSEQALLRLYRKQLHKGISRVRSLWIEGLIYVDQQQWFVNRQSRKLYRTLYNWALKGAPVTLLDRIADEIAALISADDRQALRELNAMGFRMLVISCGTQDLCQKVLEKADVRKCFETVRANPFKLEANRVAGGESRLVAAEDKLSLARKVTGNNPEGVVAVGDGYTDMPLLDWVQWPVMMDPDQSNQRKYASKPYRFIPSLKALPGLLTQR